MHQRTLIFQVPPIDKNFVHDARLSDETLVIDENIIWNVYFEAQQPKRSYTDISVLAHILLLIAVAVCKHWGAICKHSVFHARCIDLRQRVTRASGLGQEKHGNVVSRQLCVRGQSFLWFRHDGVASQTTDQVWSEEEANWYSTEEEDTLRSANWLPGIWISQKSWQTSSLTPRFFRQNQSSKHKSKEQQYYTKNRRNIEHQSVKVVEHFRLVADHWHHQVSRVKIANLHWVFETQLGNDIIDEACLACTFVAKDQWEIHHSRTRDNWIQDNECLGQAAPQIIALYQVVVVIWSYLIVYLPLTIFIGAPSKLLVLSQNQQYPLL